MCLCVQLTCILSWPFVECSDVLQVRPAVQYFPVSNPESETMDKSTDKVALKVTNHTKKGLLLGFLYLKSESN